MSQPFPRPQRPQERMEDPPLRRGVARPPLSHLLPAVPVVDEMTAKAPAEEPVADRFVVPAGMVIENGRFDAANRDIEVQGHLVGDLSVRTVCVKSGGVLRGRVLAEDVVIEGGALVEADVTCIRAAVMRDATFKGTLRYEQVMCKLGSSVEGTLSKVPFLGGDVPDEAKAAGAT